MKKAVKKGASCKQVLFSFYWGSVAFSMLTTLPREYLCMILDSGESYFVAVTCNGVLFKCVIHKLGKRTCEVYGI